MLWMKKSLIELQIKNCATPGELISNLLKLFLTDEALELCTIKGTSRGAKSEAQKNRPQIYPLVISAIKSTYFTGCGKLMKNGSGTFRARRHWPAERQVGTR